MFLKIFSCCETLINKTNYKSFQKILNLFWSLQYFSYCQIDATIAAQLYIRLEVEVLIVLIVVEVILESFNSGAQKKV